MPDLSVAASVTRALLGLPDLDLNDHSSSYLGAAFLGSQQTWTRTEVTSPFVDGAATTYRTRAVVQQPLALEVLGADAAELQVNLRALLDAFSQDHYVLNFSLGASAFAYACEAADYQIDWTPARLAANQKLLSLSIPMQPGSLLAGSY